MIVFADSLFLPPIPFFQRILTADYLLIDQIARYKKRTYHNRANILTANGVVTLTVPVHYTSNMPVKDVTIDHDQPWKRNLIRTLQTAYNKSAYYLHYGSQLEAHILKNHKYLIDLNNDLLTYCMSILKLRTKIIEKESVTNFFANNMLDLRTHYLPKQCFPVLRPDRKEYYQMFGANFVENLSIVDLIFNMGTNSTEYLYKKLNQNQ